MMDTTTIAQHAQELRLRVRNYAERERGAADANYAGAAKAQVCEFLRNYAGRKSAFFAQAEAMAGGTAYAILSLDAILESFIEYLRTGLATGVPPERQAQLDTVSDLLGQAHSLLEDEKYHPAAAAVLIGACLEEFLRAWVEAEALSIGKSKPTIDAYTKTLRNAELISKQDVKDITSWAGTRNDAAHGKWEEVGDRRRIKLMLDGVNFFMRQSEGT